MEYERKELSELKKNRDVDLILPILWEAGKLEDESQVKRFTLNPDELLYDDRGNVYLKKEDELNDDSKWDFLAEYKALIGSMLQTKYKFVDYIEGGLSLLKKDKLLNDVYLAESVIDVRKILREEHTKVIEGKKKNKIEVKRRRFIILEIFIVIFAISTLILGVYYLKDYQKDKRSIAFINAFEAYQAKEYISVIDSLSSVDSSYMDSKEKYILAISYIRSENLTDEQKENIINDLNLLNIEKLYDYWICLGRSEFEGSQNIAMQLSNNELLLYSYMKERENLINNTTLDGQKKTDRLSELEKYIQDYKSEYEKKAEASSTGFEMN